MQITLDNAEINKAITDCIATQGVDVHNKNVEVVFKSGRKGSGNTATVNITEKGADETSNAPEFGGKATMAGEG